MWPLTFHQVWPKYVTQNDPLIFVTEIYVNKSAPMTDFIKSTLIFLFCFAFHSFFSQKLNITHKLKNINNCNKKKNHKHFYQPFFSADPEFCISEESAPQRKSPQE